MTRSARSVTSVSSRAISRVGGGEDDLAISFEYPSYCSDGGKPKRVPSPSKLLPMGATARALAAAGWSSDGIMISASDSKNVGRRDEVEASPTEKKGGGASSKGGGAPLGKALGPGWFKSWSST